MPNDCWNNMTITCENIEELKLLITNELQHEDNGKFVYHENIEVVKKGIKGIIFRLWTPWHPNYGWMEELIKKYPSCWVKNLWDEEGGYAGVWIGYTNIDNEQIINQLEWNDLCIEAKHYLFLEEGEKEKEKEE